MSHEWVDTVFERLDKLGTLGVATLLAVALGWHAIDDDADDREMMREIARSYDRMAAAVESRNEKLERQLTKFDKLTEELRR